jgi:hypothetical protein
MDHSSSFHEPVGHSFLGLIEQFVANGPHPYNSLMHIYYMSCFKKSIVNNDHTHVDIITTIVAKEFKLFETMA